MKKRKEAVMTDMERTRQKMKEERCKGKQRGEIRNESRKKRRREEEKTTAIKAFNKSKCVLNECYKNRDQRRCNMWDSLEQKLCELLTPS